jgi:hypothetical protein
MEKKEFYTLDELKDFLKFRESYDKLSEFCQYEKRSMIIPLTTSIGQSLPPFFSDTEPDMPGVILYKEATLFDDVREVVNHWTEKIPGAKNLNKLDIEDKQKCQEQIVKYLVAFEQLCKARRNFPVNISEVYSIEELWMKEGYISIIDIKHLKDGFNEEQKQKLKNIKSSFFMYIKDSFEQSMV